MKGWFVKNYCWDICLFFLVVTFLSLLLMLVSLSMLLSVSSSSSWLLPSSPSTLGSFPLGLRPGLATLSLFPCLGAVPP